jgi:hypothetical protein
MARPKMTEKQKETLDKMKTIREIDATNLREVITAKLKWLENEKKKGETARQELLQKLELIKYQLARLDGISLFINDLLEPKENKVEESHDKSKI